MGKVYLRGHVIHGVPGPGGAAPACAGASIKVYDIDEGGNGNDLIFQGTTDQRGDFSGWSDNWEDDNAKKVIIPIPGHYEGVPPKWVGPSEKVVEQAIPDVLLLRIRVEHGGQRVELPFVNVPAPGAPQVIVVPWPQAPIVIGAVNGTAITTANMANLYELVKDLAESNVPKIKIRIYGPYATALQPILQPRDQLRAWLLPRIGVPVSSSLLTPNPADWVIVSCCIILAVVVIALGLGGPIALGAGFFLACLGVALVLGVYLGYLRISAQQCSRLDIPTDQVPVGFENCVTITMER